MAWMGGGCYLGGGGYETHVCVKSFLSKLGGLWMCNTAAALDWTFATLLPGQLG